METIRILLTEDDEDDAFFLKTIFKELYGDSIQVICPTNLEECRSLLSPKDRADLLILDYHLPPGTALELLEWLPSQPHLQSVKTLLWSSGISQSEVEQCLRAGLTSYVPKALGYAGTKQTLKRLLDEWLPGLS